MSTLLCCTKTIKTEIIWIVSYSLWFLSDLIVYLPLFLILQFSDKKKATTEKLLHYKFKTKLIYCHFNKAVVLAQLTSHNCLAFANLHLKLSISFPQWRTSSEDFYPLHVGELRSRLVRQSFVNPFSQTSSTNR